MRSRVEYCAQTLALKREWCDALFMQTNTATFDATLDLDNGAFEAALTAAVASLGNVADEDGAVALMLVMPADEEIAIVLGGDTELEREIQSEDWVVLAKDVAGLLEGVRKLV